MLKGTCRSSSPQLSSGTWRRTPVDKSQLRHDVLIPKPISCRVGNGKTCPWGRENSSTAECQKPTDLDRAHARGVWRVHLQGCSVKLRHHKYGDFHQAGSSSGISHDSCCLLRDMIPAWRQAQKGPGFAQDQRIKSCRTM